MRIIALTSFSLVLIISRTKESILWSLLTLTEENVLQPDLVVGTNKIQHLREQYPVHRAPLAANIEVNSVATISVTFVWVLFVFAKDFGDFRMFWECPEEMCRECSGWSVRERRRTWKCMNIPRYSGTPPWLEATRVYYPKRFFVHGRHCSLSTASHSLPPEDSPEEHGNLRALRTELSCWLRSRTEPFTGSVHSIGNKSVAN